MPKKIPLLWFWDPNGPFPYLLISGAISAFVILAKWALGRASFFDFFPSFRIFPFSILQCSLAPLEGARSRGHGKKSQKRNALPFPGQTSVPSFPARWRNEPSARRTTRAQQRVRRTPHTLARKRKTGTTCACSAEEGARSRGPWVKAGREAPSRGKRESH